MGDPTKSRHEYVVSIDDEHGTFPVLKTPSSKYACVTARKAVDDGKLNVTIMVRPRAAEQ